MTDYLGVVADGDNWSATVTFVGAGGDVDIILGSFAEKTEAAQKVSIGYINEVNWVEGEEAAFIALVATEFNSIPPSLKEFHRESAEV